MNSTPPLVGAVASGRIQAALVLPASLVSCAPAFVGRAPGPELTTSVAVGVLLFAISFGAMLKARPKSWYRTRLQAMTAPPLNATVVPPDETFDLFSRALTKPLALGLAIGLALAFTTGAPVGAAFAAFACFLLLRAHWLAGQERELGGRVVTPHAPVRVQPDDPHRAVYLEVPFYLAPAAA
ncbi:hypothetical protein [Kitasatospora sp. NPDC002040]|uniref:hypothetical protein n=1 Tax=Kitasatospora sp. NPDC002040 TaxID=3154661 RepID=UPI00331D9A0F